MSRSRIGDLTVSALRRLLLTLVNRFTRDGQYVRAFEGPGGSLIARVTQTRADSLTITLNGALGEHPQALALVRRMLGVDRDLSHFNRAAATIPWLRPLAKRMRGVKPPRYPTLWEACVNAIVFQQVSLHAASAILGRIILEVGTLDGSSCYAFPSATSVQRVVDGLLLAAGLSARKLATLRHIGDALLSGVLDETLLEERTSPDAIELLCRIKDRPMDSHGHFVTRIGSARCVFDERLERCSQSHACRGAVADRDRGDPA